MAQKFADAARAPKLSAGIAAGDTSITVTSGGALFPVANAGTGAVGGATDWFKAVLQDEAGFEIIYVRTHASGSNSFTNVLRGQDGTTAKAFTTDTVMGIRPVASDADATTNKRVIVTSGTGAALLPAGTTGERDAAPIAGMMRLNTTSGDFEGYIAGSWRTIGASGLISAKVEITATVGQTVFAAAYTVGLIDVYRNGVLLGTADYVATNGTSITLPGGAMTGDLVTIVVYKAATIANAIAKGGDTYTGSHDMRGATVQVATQIASNSSNAPASTAFVKDAADSIKAIVTDVAHGGTGANNVTTARANLGLKTAAVADIIGTVSQAAGVPTGSIIQRGSNANGEFVRFADGTQICWHQFGTTPFTTGAPGQGTPIGGWTFPSSFAAAPIVSIGLVGSYSSVLLASADGADKNNAYPIYVSSAAANVSFSGAITCFAVGRWF